MLHDMKHFGEYVTFTLSNTTTIRSLIHQRTYSIFLFCCIQIIYVTWSYTDWVYVFSSPKSYLQYESRKGKISCLFSALIIEIMMKKDLPINAKLEKQLDTHG